MILKVSNLYNYTFWSLYILFHRYSIKNKWNLYKFGFFYLLYVCLVFCLESEKANWKYYWSYKYVEPLYIIILQFKTLVKFCPGKTVKTISQFNIPLIRFLVWKSKNEVSLYIKYTFINLTQIRRKNSRSAREGSLTGFYF